MAMWGLLSTLTGIAHNAAGLYALRFFLGFVEAAFYRKSNILFFDLQTFADKYDDMQPALSSLSPPGTAAPKWASAVPFSSQQHNSAVHLVASLEQVSRMVLRVLVGSSHGVGSSSSRAPSQSSWRSAPSSYSRTGHLRPAGSPPPSAPLPSGT